MKFDRKKKQKQSDLVYGTFAVFFSLRMRMDQVWVYKRHYMLHRNDFSVAQYLRAQLLLRSAALVLGLVFVSASVDLVQTFSFGSTFKVWTFGLGSAGGGGVIVW